MVDSGNGESCMRVSYFSGYQKPKELKEQWEIIKNYFPSLKISEENLNSEFSQVRYPKAEGNFLIPDWRLIAPDYAQAVVVSLVFLRSSLDDKFKNFREGRINDNTLKQSRQLVTAYQKIRERQIGDVFVVPAQFGSRHVYKTTSSSREKMDKNEFGSGLFANIIMLLTHPERLCNRFDPWFDCAGDDYLSLAGKLLEAPYFFFDNKICLGSYPTNLNRSGYCTPTFFI